MTRVGFSENTKTYNQLLSHYNQKHRYYHNIHHINAVLNHLKQVRHLANNYDAIEIALWFHDAIYKIFSSTNELDSANWATSFLDKNGASQELSTKVHALIMATLHNTIPIDNDEKLMVDIDLSILGCTPDFYSSFESWIRKEYKLIPGFVYKKKRKEILSSFLVRDRIYSHDFFYEKLEQTARANIKNAISHL